MKITVQYELPEDELRYEAALDALDVSSFLCDYANQLRSKAKHMDEEISWDIAYEMFMQIANEHEVDPF